MDEKKARFFIPTNKNLTTPGTALSSSESVAAGDRILKTDEGKIMKREYGILKTWLDPVNKDNSVVPSGKTVFGRKDRATYKKAQKLEPDFAGLFLIRK